jgi:hypothetical protein
MSGRRKARRVSNEIADLVEATRQPLIQRLMLAAPIKAKAAEQIP